MEIISTGPVDAFKDLQLNLLGIIKKNKINVYKMSKTLSISRHTFYRRLKNISFTAPEFEQICNYINNNPTNGK